eukprot:GHRR01033206.1.p1 GENE.GHRR01033206.1~~GHRR01033206.1.p1  ORF type:complete len:110 (-),score=15.49 GHRR01033206.1:252-581(-)
MWPHSAMVKVTPPFLACSDVLPAGLCVYRTPTHVHCHVHKRLVYVQQQHAAYLTVLNPASSTLLAELTTMQNLGTGTSKSLPCRCASCKDAANNAAAVAPWLKPNKPSG